jgi:TM2 domain-containing membrane protein YozV
MSVSNIQIEEDAIREKIAQLSPELRKAYYIQESERLKDPDTYAVLCYGLMCGIHHLYLRKYTSAIVDVMLLVSCIIVFILSAPLGLVGFCVLAARGLYFLFTSKNEVEKYNLALMKEILAEIGA